MSPNETETAQITGISPANSEMCLQACMRLRSMANVEYVVLKLSDRGCCSYNGKDFDYVPSLYVSAVDATAAGDAFTTALACEYVKSKNLPKACRYANAVGALTVTRFGAMPSLPTKQIYNGQPRS